MNILYVVLIAFITALFTKFIILGNDPAPFIANLHQLGAQFKLFFAPIVQLGPEMLSMIMLTVVVVLLGAYIILRR